MIIDIYHNCSNRLIKIKDDIIDSILLTDHNILDNMWLEMLIVHGKINLLLSQPIFPSKII